MKLLRIVLILFFIILCLIVGIFYSQFRGFGKNQPKERFVVALNASEEQIVDNLYQKGFLRNKTIFGWVLDLKKWRSKVEPGAYMVSKSMNAYELAGTLVYGPFQKWAVIPPGKRKEQVGLILQKSLNWPDDMVLSFVRIAKEGYLWPDTYLFNTDADPKQIAARLENEFNTRLEKLKTDFKTKNVSLQTAVIMASLIERESGSLEDKPIIAGILWNRLKKKMRLEIDATVQYAIGTSEFSKYTVNNKITYPEDFSFWSPLGAGIVRIVDSPYNTYKIKALPIGPICSPSIEAIRAVANPTDTDALYYLHSPDKKIHTAKTYKEHQGNINKYLE